MIVFIGMRLKRQEQNLKKEIAMFKKKLKKF